MNQEAAMLRDILAELKRINEYLYWMKRDTLEQRAQAEREAESAHHAQQVELMALQDRMADVLVERQKEVQQRAYAEHVAAYHQDVTSNQKEKDNPPRA